MSVIKLMPKFSEAHVSIVSVNVEIHDFALLTKQWAVNLIKMLICCYTVC